MNIKIQPETDADFELVHQLVEDCYATKSYINHYEAQAVKTLRESPTFIPSLSLVLYLDQKLIGYALFTPVVIKDDQNSHVSLATTLLAVTSKYQKLGFGAQLLNHGISEARKIGFKSMIAIGNFDYYKKFGFRPAQDYKISLSQPKIDASCYMLELENNGLNAVHGEIKFPQEIANFNSAP